MEQLRVSKYNPRLRDKDGLYLKREWTEYNQISDYYPSPNNAFKEYEKVEKKYSSIILSFFKINNCEQIEIANKEFKDVDMLLNDSNSKNLLPMYERLKNESLIEIQELGNVVLLILRGFVWAEIKCAKKNISVEFGYDFYIYLNSGSFSKEVYEIINSNDLYVE